MDSSIAEKGAGGLGLSTATPPANPYEKGAGGLDLSTATPPATPYERAQDEYQAQFEKLRKTQDEITASLNSRQGAGNPLFALAQGFLAPTKGGGFGESAGNAMQMFGTQQQQQQKQDQDTAMMRLQLAQASLAPSKELMDIAKEKEIKNIASQLYIKNNSGNFVLNPEAAQALTRLTGKPEYVQQIVAEQRKRQQGSAFNSMFVQKETPDGTQVEFDKNAFKNFMSVSDNPLDDAIKFADVFKKVRPLMFGSNDKSSVFDAAILGAKDYPDILLLARQYKKLEQAGQIDDEKAYKMAMDLTTLLSKKSDSADARQDRFNLAMITQAIHATTAGTTSALNAERLERMKAELTPQQKKDYAIIEPSLKNAPKAGDMIMQIADLSRYNKIAPDGLFSSAWESTVGAYNNSPEYLAAQNMKRTIAGMIPNTARLPGSASNLDLVKIEESLGKLQAPNLNRQGRETIIKEMDNSVRRILDRTVKIQSYWEDNKKAPPPQFYIDEAKNETKTPRKVINTGIVTSGENAGKRVTEYSDGTKEYR